MFVRRLSAAAVAALLAGSWIAAPVVAEASIQPVAAGVQTLSPGRLGAVAAALPALTGVVIGGLALARSTGRTGAGGGGGRATAALVLGLTAMVAGGVVIVTAEGGLGTGNGLGGGAVAMVLGLIGTVLGGLARTRSRRLRA